MKSLKFSKTMISCNSFQVNTICGQQTYHQIYHASLEDAYYFKTIHSSSDDPECPKQTAHARTFEQNKAEQSRFQYTHLLMSNMLQTWSQYNIIRLMFTRPHTGSTHIPGYTTRG